MNADWAYIALAVCGAIFLFVTGYYIGRMDEIHRNIDEVAP